MTSSTSHPALAEGLARVQRLVEGDRLEVADQELGGPGQHGAALGRGEPRPVGRVEGPTGGADRLLDVGVVGDVDGTDRARVVGVHDRAGRSRGGAGPLPVDVETRHGPSILIGGDATRCEPAVPVDACPTASGAASSGVKFRSVPGAVRGSAAGSCGLRRVRRPWRGPVGRGDGPRSCHMTTRRSLVTPIEAVARRIARETYRATLRAGWIRSSGSSRIDPDRAQTPSNDRVVGV